MAIPLYIPARMAGREGIPSDNPFLRITTVKLDGMNYLTRSRSVILAFKAEGCIDILLEVRQKNLMLYMING